MLEIGLGHYLVLSAFLFGCGLACILTKRNAIGILMGVELILNAANVNLVAFNCYNMTGARAGAGVEPAIDGLMFALFIIVLAASEAAIAMAIVLNFYNSFGTIDIERANQLRG